MAYDPLSRATRKARTGLMAVTTAYFFAKEFDVRLSSDPIYGIQIDRSDEFMNSLLLIIMLYFFAMFMIYAIDDYINRNETEYVRSKRKVLAEFIDELDRRANQIREDLEEAIKNIDPAFDEMSEKYDIESHSRKREREYIEELNIIIDQRMAIKDERKALRDGIFSINRLLYIEIILPIFYSSAVMIGAILGLIPIGI